MIRKGCPDFFCAVGLIWDPRGIVRALPTITVKSKYDSVTTSQNLTELPETVEIKISQFDVESTF